MSINKMVLVLAVVFCGLALSQVTMLAADEAPISGEIVNGLRILTLNPGPNNSFVVYRGDYVQPQLAGMETFEMTIPELKVAKKFPEKDGGKGYVKLIDPGTFAFTAGPASGTFKVIEYDAPSYTALTAAEAERILKNTNPLILDVRTEMEYQQGHIQGAKLLPVQVLQQNIRQLEGYKQQDVLIYCASGNRSTVASRLLIENGFNKIYNLRYGIGDWIQKGYPVVR